MDLLKIKIKDTMARVTLREYLDSHDIMYFTKKKSIYVKPETSCQGLFHQIHKKSTKKVPEAPYGS